MMRVSDDTSIVEYYAEHSGYRCGYCKSPNTNFSQGMWAHGLSVQDYQDLIDRGWRRSGHYCYKPAMHLTCCPMYTIKCSVLDFKLSKSQKKKLKRFHNFLAYGKKSNNTLVDNGTEEPSSFTECADDVVSDMCDFPDLKQKAERAQSNITNTKINSFDAAFKNCFPDEENKKEKDIEVAVSSASSTSRDRIVCEKQDESPTTIKRAIRPGDGIDPNRPHCKKAKLKRQERKEKKLAQLSLLTKDSHALKTPPVSKSIEDFINEPLPDSPAHRLEIKLVSVASTEMSKTVETSLALFARYQVAIHNEEPDECNMSSYTNFLIDSPLKPWKPQEGGPPQGYGSFHQQYWLDDRLIAVGVIDILPYCVSSVYFFYDPEFHFLVLGTYGSLREIGFCRSLNHLAPSLRYYYMGFYIHSCPKMRYKGELSPSFLLCPEVYSWHPIEKCLPLLEKSKYSRLQLDPEAKDSEAVVNVRDVSVLFNNQAMYYHKYLSHNKSNSHLREVTQYANLVGNKLSKRMLLLLT